MSADLPLTTHELATIKARAELVDEGPGDYDVRDILRLVAEIERLRATLRRVDEVRRGHLDAAQSSSITARYGKYEHHADSAQLLLEALNE